MFVPNRFVIFDERRATSVVVREAGRASQPARRVDERRRQAEVARERIAEARTPSVSVA